MKYLGVVLLVLALVVALVPQFTTCESQGKVLTLTSGKTVPMKCTWTARAEMAVAIPILVVGALMSFTRRRESRISLSILGTILGIAVMMLPTNLIGVCSSRMLCDTVMEPTLLSLGGLITGLSVIGLVVSVGVKRKVDELSKVSHS